MSRSLPFWRWMRDVAATESTALRVWAAEGRIPPRSRPISFVELLNAGEYNPARQSDRLGTDRVVVRRRPFAPIPAAKWDALHPLVRSCLEVDLEAHQEAVA